MRISIIILLTFFSLNNSYATLKEDIDQTLKKYFLVVDDHRVDLINEVFEKKYLESELGGVENYKKNVLSVKKSKSNTIPNYKIKPLDKNQNEVVVQFQSSKVKTEDFPDFIFVKENGKYKLKGTLNAEN